LKIQPGEKFACIVFSFFDVELRTALPADLGYGCILSNSLPFALSDWAHRWLGEFIIEQLETRPRVVLTAVQKARKPETLDDENQVLVERVSHVLWGLSAVAGVPVFNLARLFSGSNFDGKTGIRQMATVEQLYRSVQVRPVAQLANLKQAALFARRLDDIMRRKRENPKFFWRLVSGVNAFVNGLNAPDEEVRLHQFVRAIESFHPASSSGRRAFVEYSKLFVANSEETSVQNTLAEMYDLRSAAEHHRHFADRALPAIDDPGTRARLRGRQSEVFARELYRRLFCVDAELLDLFRDEETLEKTWIERDSLLANWGSPLDLNQVL
jgi:hypothetical protein